MVQVASYGWSVDARCSSTPSFALLDFRQIDLVRALLRARAAGAVGEPPCWYKRGSVRDGGVACWCCSGLSYACLCCESAGELRQHGSLNELQRRVYDSPERVAQMMVLCGSAALVNAVGAYICVRLWRL
jgi:hypothetical protein